MIRSALKSYLRDEKGTLSIEAMFWVVLVAFTMAIFVDGSAIFRAQGNVLRIVQDANRAYAAGFIKDTDSVTAYIKDRLALIAPDAEVETVLTSDDEMISTRVVATAADFEVFHTIPALSSVKIGVYTRHTVEERFDPSAL